MESGVQSEMERQLLALLNARVQLRLEKIAGLVKTVGSMEMVPSKLATTEILDQRLRFKRADTQLEIEPEEPVRARFITR